jgi:hypothetical protein
MAKLGKFQTSLSINKQDDQKKKISDVDSVSKLSLKKAEQSVRLLANKIESFVKAVEEQKQKNDY